MTNHVIKKRYYNFLMQERKRKMDISKYEYVYEKMIENKWSSCSIDSNVPNQKI